MLSGGYAVGSNMSTDPCIAEIPVNLLVRRECLRAPKALGEAIPLATDPTRPAVGTPDSSEVRPGGRLVRRALTMVAILFFSFAAYWAFSRYVVMTVIVQGRSMQPTLHDGDRLMLSRIAFLARDPRPGDLVVLKDPGHNDYAVKRIVGLPRDWLYFHKGEVLKNNCALHEAYLAPGTLTFTPDFKDQWVELGPDDYFVLGDNRGNSEDSRYYGPIHRSQILGLVLH